MRHLLTCLGLTALLCVPFGAKQYRDPRVAPVSFLATAFAQKGITKSGMPAQAGVVAADTRVLPLGTTIEVRNAGPYSGNYTVADTGSTISGRQIEIILGLWWGAK